MTKPPRMTKAKIAETRPAPTRRPGVRSIDLKEGLIVRFVSQAIARTPAPPQRPRAINL